MNVYQVLHIQQHSHTVHKVRVSEDQFPRSDRGAGAICLDDDGADLTHPYGPFPHTQAVPGPSSAARLCSSVAVSQVPHLLLATAAAARPPSAPLLTDNTHADGSRRNM